MIMDSAVQVAAIGVFATLITTAGIVVVAIINNRKERGGAAGEGVEATLRERVAFAEAKNEVLERENATLHRDNARKDLVIERLRKDQTASRKNP